MVLAWPKFNIFKKISHLILQFSKLSPYLPNLTSAFLSSASQTEKRIKFIATASFGPSKSLYPFGKPDYFLGLAVLNLPLYFLHCKNGVEKPL